MLRERKAARDAILIFGSFALAYGVAVFLGFVEQLHAFLERRDEIIIDQLFVLGGFSVAALLVFAARRVVDQHVEIRRRKGAEQRLRILALHDPLTGLPNRAQLTEEIVLALGQRPQNGRCHALLLLDLNGFKRLNDVFGHPAGDEVLVAISKRLRTQVGDQRLIARLGGDEFAILCCDLAGPEDAKRVIRRVLLTFEAPFPAAGNKHPVSVGIGIALSPGDADSASELMQRGDIALYQAKRGTSASSYCFFEPSMEHAVRGRAALEIELGAALKARTIVPHYQQIVDLTTGAITGFEALARWMHPVRGAIPPDEFIPVAEETGLIRGLTEAMLQASCSDAVGWPSSIRLAFNLSAVLLKDPSLGARILRVLSETGLPPSRLEIEVTESALVNDLKAAQEVLGALRNAGARIALDDFGTGYASLYHLRNFKFDAIKIDRTYVAALGNDAQNDAILRSVLVLADGLGLSVTAEGVETDRQRTELTRLGCREGQGFLFGKAVPGPDVASLIRGPHELSSPSV